MIRIAQVYRPEGPGTSSFINLEGTCNNELPQYVAGFNGVSGSNIIILNPSFSSLANGFTISVWIEPTANTFGAIFSTNCFGFRINPGNPYGVAFAGPGGGCAPNLNAGSTSSMLNTWSFLTVVGGPSTQFKVYDDGVLVYSPVSSSFAMPNSIVAVGMGLTNLPTATNAYTGGMADVQRYNASLSANEVTALYQEGIGGVPLNLNNLVGWWPLNGNANDYSGNLNNGAPVNVVYTSSWTSGYTAP